MIDLTKTIDLSTTYLGLKLKNPLVASSSPMCREVGNIRRLEDAGASAIVLHSLFEEQIELDSEELDRFMTEGSDVSAESTASHFPDLLFKVMGPEAYLKHIVKCKEAVKIPIVASLNGTTTGGWIGYAKEMQQAGADALELNIYHIPVDPNVTGEQVEQKYIDLIQAVKKEVTIPVSVKLGPYFSSMANMAKRLDVSGADVVKSMMAGAKVAMMTSALLKRGITFLDTIATELLVWMGEHEYDSIKQMQGSMSRNAVPQPGAFERANYMKVLSSYAMR